ncbi:hypothetical protein ACKVWC_009980 [Pyricularia oryzae]|nr:hypothetical protein MCOR01_003361 [Pyricularia oryzae]KAI6362123.1 hypothetical protein MCOR31_008382 [Pyricularia oryzae]KAI6427122.1 hypothetical protein MCOR21_006380 [Pyricularia oryzae]KAI6430680.1 hypothetical protein MCOR24_001812 [Pyricularia oryzae]KAI6443637.1 hypothetical protein MCOR22_005266 [Pyricularia oryzae]
MSAELKLEGRYRLEVVGGNEAINRALIQQLPTLRGSIVAGVAADAGSSPSTQACEIFPSSASSATPLTLFADKPSGETIYALRGPSGKGDLQLVQMPAPTGEGRRLVGSSVMSDGWKIVESWGRLLLRYSEEPAGLSHWVAVPREEEGEDGKATKRWTFWWVAPNGANMNDLPGHVLVDIQVVPVE